MPSIVLSESALELAMVQPGDEQFPATLDGFSLALNRMRLAAFLHGFAEDKDVADLLYLDLLAWATGLPITSTGGSDPHSGLALRPFRLWEYTWLYKALGLALGSRTVLDLGGPASHITILAALAGCAVTSIDLNPEFVLAAEDCGRRLGLPRLEPRVGDMRDLTVFPDGTFDIVMSCSVLEHLTGEDQEVALKEVARVLKPGGLVGLTFDFGPAAPGANEYLPPPHDPPKTAAEASRRYTQDGLCSIGNELSEDPIPGSLFHDDTARYTVASLVLAKMPCPTVSIPECARSGPRVFRTPTIVDLPYQIFETRRRAVRQLAQVNAQLESATKQTAIFQEAAEERLQAMRKIEEAANERLVLLQAAHEAAASLRAELDARDAIIAKLRKHLENAAALLRAGQ